MVHALFIILVAPYPSLNPSLNPSEGSSAQPALCLV